LKSTSANTLKESLAQVAGNPLRMVRLAHMLVAVKQEPAKARELCTQALALAPDDPEVATLAAEVLCADIPTWHFSLVRDTARNAAYDAALRRAVRPGSRVLDIGAGTGLLAMMAARAGAAHVVTCEANPVVAERTAAIVAHNGFADRIKVIAKNSNALEIGVDIDEPVDILVSEIIADNLLGEYVLPTMERAVPRLLKPGATIIPARGALRMALAQDCKTSRHRIVNMDVTDGFDLSPFNTLGHTLIRFGSATSTWRCAGSLPIYLRSISAPAAPIRPGAARSRSPPTAPPMAWCSGSRWISMA
jgi:protein arginine N-methyltransferase 7